MRRYVLRRLLVAVPSLLIASLIVFTLPRLIPGDVVQLMLEEKAYGKDLEDLRAKLGLNRPIPVQYVEWLGAIVRGNMGESLWTRQPVVIERAPRRPASCGARAACCWKSCATTTCAPPGPRRCASATSSSSTR